MKNLTIIFVLFTTLSCQHKNAMKEQQKIMVEKYVKSYNDFDIKGMIENLSEDIVFKNVSNGNVDFRTEGIAEFKKQAESAKQYFSQRKQTIETWNFSEPKITIGIDYKAILKVDLPNGLKRGDTLKLKGKSEFEFENGKIKSITDKS